VCIVLTVFIVLIYSNSTD